MGTIIVRTKPIIFTGESVRAILEGRKTQTRRVVKPQPVDGKIWWESEWEGGGSFVSSPLDSVRTVWKSYRVGDLLYVKEAWDGVQLQGGGSLVSYKANGDTPVHDGNKWKSPLFMPRWAARLFLRVTEVRVERLQHMIEQDAWAEGFSHTIDEQPGATTKRSAVSYYAEAWDKINGKKHPWSSNPWVWVISFKIPEAF